MFFILSLVLLSSIIYYIYSWIYIQYILLFLLALILLIFLILLVTPYYINH